MSSRSGCPLSESAALGGSRGRVPTYPSPLSNFDGALFWPLSYPKVLTFLTRVQISKVEASTEAYTFYLDRTQAEGRGSPCPVPPGEEDTLLPPRAGGTPPLQIRTCWRYLLHLATYYELLNP